jgi:hypothetical protein
LIELIPQIGVVVEDGTNGGFATMLRKTGDLLQPHPGGCVIDDSVLHGLPKRSASQTPIDIGNLIACDLMEQIMDKLLVAACNQAGDVNCHGSPPSDSQCCRGPLRPVFWVDSQPASTFWCGQRALF